MAPAQRLLSIEAIKQLKARYFRFLQLQLGPTETGPERYV